MLQNYHIPILKETIISFLNLENALEDSIFVDATLGDGGHTEAVAKILNGRGQIFCIDKDKEAIARAKNRLKDFNNIFYFNNSYENLEEVLVSREITKINGIIFDLGVSSFQFDSSGRGFSFLRDEPLDMRMNVEAELTAYSVVNTFSEEELTKILWEFGEERWSKNIVREIVKIRKDKPIESTNQLVEIIKKSIPQKYYPHHHVATKTFQALRIAVNRELLDLENTIRKAIDFLCFEGRICIISFHSLEDRIVKNTFKSLVGECTCPPHLPVCACNIKKVIKVLNKKPIIPSSEEISNNPRSRSAKLRIGEKL